MSETRELDKPQVVFRSVALVGHLLGRIGRSWDHVRFRLLGRVGHWAALPPVSSADVPGALEALARVGRVDLPSYLEAIEPTRLMSERLGPTAACLTLGDLDAEPRTPEGGRVQTHVVGCRACGEAWNAFQLVKTHELDPAMCNVTAEFPGHIVVGEEFAFDLKFLAPRGVSIVPTSVAMDGLFRNVICEPMQIVDRNPSGETLLVAKCVGHTRRDLLEAGDVSGEIVDWVTVTGQTTTGHRFTSRALVRVTERNAYQR